VQLIFCNMIMTAESFIDFKWQTGMEISGQGINKNTLIYMGSFDGEKLFADMHFVGQQTVPGAMTFFAELVDGPVMINFMIDLTIAE
jgi:hypothetical protein